MKKGSLFPCTICIAALSFAFLFAACGSDETAPSIDTSFIPQTVFYNDTGTDEFFLFTGRATDNTNVDNVFISVDNGFSWDVAEIDNDPPNKLWDVEWTYLASSVDMSAGIHTVLIRAEDRDNNETTSGPVTLEVFFGSTLGELLAMFAAAATGDYIGLSTGEGDAYGDSTTTLTIPINVDLTVQGSGYGDMLTSGGHSPAGNSVATVLDTDPVTANLFSVDADFTIRNLRLLGALYGIHLSDDGGSDPELSIQGCLFDRQAAWAVYADDDNGNVNIEFLSSIVDASRADSPSGGGGLYIDNLNYTVMNSQFYSQSTAASGAGIQAVGGTGTIDDNIFDGNALAIWASGGAPTISSCMISGAAYTTNGIDLSGSGTSPTIRNNEIRENNGFGIRIRGNSEPRLFGNEIHSDSITYSNAVGILVQDSGALPELGKFPWDESGCNKFASSSSITEDFVIEVDSSTSAASVIFAGNNFWGVLFDTGSEIHTYKIHDGNDGDNGSAAIVDLTGVQGGTNPVIWNGTGDCP